jgi:hypothetical protein
MLRFRLGSVKDLGIVHHDINARLDHALEQLIVTATPSHAFYNQN